MGGGFRERSERPSRPDLPASRADEDSWGRSRAFQSRELSSERPQRERRGFGLSDPAKPGMDDERWGNKAPVPAAAEQPAPAAPVERKKLNLAPRSKPIEPGTPGWVPCAFCAAVHTI